MTKYEKFVISAYTGHYVARKDDWNDFVGFIEEKLGRTIYTHKIPLVTEELKKAVEQEFLNICNS